MRIPAALAALALAQGLCLAQAPSRSRTAAAAAPAPAPAPAASAPAGSTGARGYGVFVPMRSRSFGGFGSFNEPPPGPPPGVRGRVLVGGAAPILPINVLCNCAFGRFGLGYTDLRGGFYYPFYALPVSFYRLSACDLRFYAAGYWPLIVPFSDFMRPSPYRMADAGRLELVPYGDISGTTVSINSLAAPKEAKKAFEKGVKKFVQRDYDDAVESLDEALHLHPDYVAAWTLLGQVRMAQKLYPAAETAFKKAIEIDPDYVPPYAPLARLLSIRNETQEVYDLAVKGLELNPYDSDLKYLRAAAALHLGDYRDAAYFAQKIVDSNEASFFPDALFVLARAARAQGDYERAVRLYGEYYAGRGSSQVTRSVAGRELSQARLAEYTLRAMRPALP